MIQFSILRLISSFRYDYLASKTGATIVPFGAFDSVPSDVVSFLGVQKLKEVAGSDVKVGKSITAHSVKGGISGGTLATLLSAFTDVPSATLSRASAHYSLSPSTLLPFSHIVLPFISHVLMFSQGGFEK